MSDEHEGDALARVYSATHPRQPPAVFDGPFEWPTFEDRIAHARALADLDWRARQTQLEAEWRRMLALRARLEELFAQEMTEERPSQLALRASLVELQEATE